MLRRHLFLAVLAAFLLSFLTLPFSAVEPEAGTVLYHQDFAVVSSASIAGIRKGSDSSADSVVRVTDTALGIYSVDNERTYVLLPEIPWTDSYTIEFSFRFTDILASNGYLTCMLTCWGEKPDNITAVFLRASGKIDDFSAPSEEIAACMKNGEEILVEIPVDGGILDTIRLSSGEHSCTVRRDSLKQISAGTRGFSVRNASVEIGEIFVVSGTGYTAKTGDYAAESWAADIPNGSAGESAPPTGDSVGILVSVLLSAIGTVCVKRWKYIV